jgi:hypothetical protein
LFGVILSFDPIEIIGDSRARCRLAGIREVEAAKQAIA